MSRVTIRDTSQMDRLTQALNKLGRNEIKVGVFGSDDAEMVMIARVHEYGMTIKPKNGKYLTIPSSPKSKGKRAREFNDLFFIPTDNGNGLLAREKGKDQIEVLFVLVKSVTIPERSFIRAGFDQGIDKITNKMEGFLEDVISFKINPDEFSNMIGLEFAGMIQKYARDLREPPKASVTLAASPGKTNPLVDTGHLIGSIRHKVE